MFFCLQSEHPAIQQQQQQQGPMAVGSVVAEGGMSAPPMQQEQQYVEGTHQNTALEQSFRNDLNV